jgi:hypothetical protein
VRPQIAAEQHRSTRSSAGAAVVRSRPDAVARQEAFEGCEAEIVRILPFAPGDLDE